jgi:hypothetical protein
VAISAEMARARARKANADMRGDSEAASIAARDLRAVKLEEYIQRVVDEAPPLTEEQRSRLAGLLAGGAR